MGGLFCRVLGPPQAELAGVELPLGSPQARDVFALLVAEARQVVPAHRLAHELWDGSPPASARVQVQGLISRLRRALRLTGDDQPIKTRGQGYLFEPADDGSDLECFERWAGEGAALLAAGHHEQAARQLRSALELWRGPAFSGVSLTSAPEFVARWEERRLAALEDCADAELRLGGHDRLVPELREVLAAHPYRERACGQLITALARGGRAAEALAVYRDWRDRLRDELGVEPSPGLRALQSAVLRAEPGLTSQSFTAYREPATPCQLPPGIPDFVGREQLVEDLLVTLTAAPGPHMPPVLVLTGTGGIGKTALAIRLAHRVREHYPDGQLFVSLRGTTPDPRPADAVLAGFLRALGVGGEEIPADPEECAGLFRSLLHGKRVLVVLDDVAAEAQLRSLIPAASGCAVIATSRVALDGLEFGRTVPLGVLSEAEAAALLAQLGGPEVLRSASRAEIIDYCCGLPLALRIVGSRLADSTQWTLDDVAAELSVERRRLDWLQAGDLAVRSSLALSYRQLDPAARKVFRRLGLAPSADFGSWAAAALADVDGEAAERSLGALQRRHMVQVVGRDAGRPRYRTHDLLRAFAAEAVAGEPEHERREATARLLGGWLYAAERAADGLPGSILRPEPGDTARWAVPEAGAGPVAWFQAEQPGLEAAIGLAADRGLGEPAWELAVTAACYYDHRGLYAEWWRCHRRALVAARASGQVRGEAALLRGIGQLHLYWDDFPAATRALAESLRLSEELGDRPGIARALTGLSVVSRATGRTAEAETRARRALGICLGTGDGIGVAHLYTTLASIELERGALGLAESWLDQAKRVCRSLGDEHRTALLLRRYGQLHLARQDAPRALGCLRRALDVLAAMDDEQCAAQVRLEIGRAHALLGEHKAAKRALVGVSSLFTHAGNRGGAEACARLLGVLSVRAGQTYSEISTP